MFGKHSGVHPKHIYLSKNLLKLPLFTHTTPRQSSILVAWSMSPIRKISICSTKSILFSIEKRLLWNQERLWIDLLKRTTFIVSQYFHVGIRDPFVMSSNLKDGIITWTVVMYLWGSWMFKRNPLSVHKVPKALPTTSCFSKSQWSRCWTNLFMLKLSLSPSNKMHIDHKI